MPVNTSSTGATYGKSSDPLCPLGFHPQVRWPTRCKRCFRDYKEHNDSNDKKKFGNLGSSTEEDPWAAKKSAFQKSKSVDVTIESGASSLSRFANYTTAAAAASQTKAEEDIPEWKKNMLDKRAKEKENEEAKSRNFGFLPGTTLHSSYVSKSYEQDSRLSSWGSTGNLKASSSYTNLAAAEEEEEKKPASSSSSYKSKYSSSYSKPAEEEQELSPYEKYVQRKKEQEAKEAERKKKEEEDKKREEDRRKDREKRREEERKQEEEARKKREKEREERKKEEERKAKEEAEKKASSTTTRRWGSAATKEETAPAASKWGAKTTTTETAPTASKWGAKTTTPSDDVPKRKPWEKPSAAAKSTLPSLSETNSNSNDSKSTPSWKSNARKTSDSEKAPSKINNDSDHDHEVSSAKFEALSNELSAVKSRNEVLEKLHTESTAKKPLTLESAKAAETTAELIKARQKVSDTEAELSKTNKDKKALNLKIKELESALERRPQISETQKTISELQTKLKYVERKCEDLSSENDDLRGNVQNLEVELEEVQDNFREDEVDEYRSLKRELENSAKNCRVLQFKLKKAEKGLQDVQGENVELTSKLRSMSGGATAIDNLNKVRTLEREIESKNLQISRLEAEVKAGKSNSLPRKGGPGPVMSRTGSVERNVEDQLLKDLQDSIERENDLKEQLSMAEEESSEMRLKISRLEDENESLESQVKKMATKGAKRRSPSPYNRNAVIEKDEGISQDGEELSSSELKVQLEVVEGETGLLRKKVENLLTENLKLTKEVKDISGQLTDEKKKKSTPSYSSRSGQETSKVDQLQSEINAFRVKLIEKDREIERLDAQLKSSKGGRTLVRSGSQEEDLAKKLNVIEKEAEILRQKTSELEQENDTLKTENKKLHSGYGKKPASTQEKLSMDKFSLEEKVKGLETKLRESNKKITELEEAGKGSMKTSLEIDRMKREKTALDAEISKLKQSASEEKKKIEKMEKDLSMATDKADKAQREIIGSEREKRKSEEEKQRLETQVGRLETDIRSLTREKDRYKEESENARSKNRENLNQTQEGMKAFKDQIDLLKQELSEEKRSNKDMKRNMEEKIRMSDMELTTLRRDTDRKASEIDDKTKKIKDLDEKISDIEDKLAKSKRINQQRKDKIEKLERDAEDKNSGVNNSFALSEAQDRIKTLEKQLENSSSNNSTDVTKMKKDLEALKKEKLDLDKVNKQLEKDYNLLKNRLADGNGDDAATLQGELSTLRHTYNAKSDEWIKEKIDLERQIKELEQSIRASAGNGWDSERNRYKSILDDRDNQITNLKIECDVARSQHSTAKKELEDAKQKLQDYEKMNRYGKSALESSSSTDASGEVDELKKQLSAEQRERKSDLNNLKMKHDSKSAIMTEEIHALKSQTSKYKRERDQYKEMFEGMQKKLTDSKGKGGAGDATGDLHEARSKISDMSYQLHVLEDELSDAKMEAAKAHANMMSQKSNYEIQVSELNSKINEMEEETLIESGRARIAGTRTKMELAWQKERESQKKLINELNTMSRDLKGTLLEVEKEKERDRLDAKRKIDAMKKAYDEEQDDTKKQISDLQFDLLELRDAHAKLRTTNEKLRREKDRSVDDIRAQSKSRAEYGVEKQTMRLLRDMEEFLAVAPKFLGQDIMDKEDKPKLDNEKAVAKMEFKTALLRMKEMKDELDVTQRRSRRGESIETINEESPRGRSGMRNASHSVSSQKRALYRKAVSMSDGMGDNNANLWQSKESLGSSESVASNASIPLPIPVRTRSGRGGSESGYSSDAYNQMTIKRLERDTSVDRLSTGSRESTQSELLPGEKRKSRGLLGKLKKIGRSISQERTNEEQEFGSGSDISNISNQSKMSNSSKISTTSKMSTASKMIQRARSVSKDRGIEKKTPFGPPGNANAAFDKYFDKAEAAESTSQTKSTPGAVAPATRPGSRAGLAKAAESSTSTAAASSSAEGKKHPPVAATRTYRRF